MADNVAITAGTGTSIAADDVSSVFYQRIKVDGGGDGASTPILAGGGVEASALRVTIASDSTGVLSVDDNGGSLTVDGTVTVGSLPASTNTLEVVGDAAHDAAAAGNPVLVGAYASSTAPTNVSANGDAVRLWADLAGRLQVGTSSTLVDDAAFTPATSSVTMIGAEFDNVATDSVDEGDAGALRMSANRNLYVNIRDNAGNERGLSVDASGFIGVTDGAGSLTVDNGGTFVVQENGAGLTALQLIDDIVYTDDTSTHSTGSSKGALIMAAATPSDTSVNANDIGAVAMTVDRKLHVSVQDSLPAGTNAIGKLAANSGVDIGDVDVTSISAGENHLGEVGGNSTLLEVTLSLDTSAYADGDVMADTQSVSNAFRTSGGSLILQSVMVIDEDDQGQTFDIIFLDSNNALGTENSAPNITDANARTILGRVRVNSSDYIDLGANKVASLTNIGLLLKGNASTTLYVGTIIRGSATYTASGVRLRLGVLRD